MADDGQRDPALESGRLELLGRLLPPALHELANPLLALGGTVDLLLEDAEPGTRAQARLALVRDTAAELADVVRALQRLARERFEPARRIELEPFVRETASLAARFSGVKDVEVSVGGDGGGTVEVEPAVLRQALLALVLDAVQASSARSRVDVTVGPGSVRVPAAGGADRAAETAAAALGAGLRHLPGGGVELRLRE